MKRLVIKPDGWPCILAECPPGHFVTVDHFKMLCFKSEYRETIGGEEFQVEAFNEAGEVFWGEAENTAALRRGTMVQPVIAEWEEYEP